MHGVEQLGELIETLPVLARVLFTLHDGFPQLLDVRHPDLFEHCLALQAVLWNCVRRERGDLRSTSGTERTTSATVPVVSADTSHITHHNLKLQKEDRHILEFKSQ